MTAQTIGSVRRALQLMLGGVFLIVVDISYSRTVNGEGFRLDLLNDVVGALLIAVGVRRLAAARVSRRYGRLMNVALVGAAALVLSSIRGQFIGRAALPSELFWSLASLVTELAGAALCLGLAWLWAALGDSDAARRWRRVGWAQALLGGGLALAQIGLLAARLLDREEAAATPVGGALALVLALLSLAPAVVGALFLLRDERALRRLPADDPIPSGPEAQPLPRSWLAGGLAALALLIGAGGFLALRQAPLAALVRELPHDGGSLALGHGGGASFSPDGSRILLYRDGAARVLDAATGAELRSFELEGEWIYDLAYDPSGQRIAASSGIVQIFDAATGRELLRTPPGSAYDRGKIGWVRHRVRFSPDGAVLATQLHWVALYDAASGAETLVLGVDAQGSADGLGMAWSPDGRRIAIGGQDGQVRIWDAAGGMLLREFQAPGQLVNDLAWSPDGTKLASANDYNLAIIWDADTGERLREIAVSRQIDVMLGRRPHANPRNWTASIAWSPDGSKLAIGSSDASAGVWDVASGEQLWRLDGHSDYVTGLSWHPGGERLVTSSGDGKALVWDLAGR